MSLFQLIKYVLTSWQVIVVTIAIVIYFSIVSYAARSHSRPRSAKKSRPKINLFKKKEKPAAAAPIMGPETTESDENHVDDLGIEEAQ